MGRVERCGEVELWLGDSRDILPTLGPQLAVVTDPPYGVGYQHSGGGRGVARRRNSRMPIIGDDRPFDPGWLLQYPAAAIFGANHWSSIPPGGTLIAWDKSLGRGPRDLFSDCEFIWTTERTKRNVIRYLWKGVACTKASEYNGRRWHPTQKPVGVMLQLIAIMPPGLTIADPYMGAGSTLLACVRLGRPGIGVELDPRYFDAACRRVEAEVRSVEAASKVA
jgi:site-specific DNA-methyltransferase (adenine-specific)/modification methylase